MVPDRTHHHLCRDRGEADPEKYNAIFVFFASGVVILMTASLLTGTPILPKGSLGNVFLDTFGFLTATFKKNIAGIGTLIMVVTGYATYMKHIGASTKLAFTASRLLGGISNKYLILSAFYLVGMCLKLVLPSQASLAVLMLATVFPVFMALGIRPITAAPFTTAIWTGRMQPWPMRMANWGGDRKSRIRRSPFLCVPAAHPAGAGLCRAFSAVHQD